MTVEWKDVVVLLQQVIVPIIGYSAYALRGILRELRAMNGRLGKVEQWTVDHERSDDRALTRIDAALNRLESRPR